MPHMKRYLLIILCVYALTAAASTPKNEADIYLQIKENIGTFGAVYREINQRYVDDIDPEEFIKAGIEGMLGTLDPYTVFLDDQQADDLHIMSTGQYGGIGIEIGIRGKDKVLTVISPIEDSPAKRLGIRPGDKIIEISGQATAGFTTADAADLLRGEAGSIVEIKIDRIGVDEPINYTLERANITIKDVVYAGIIEDGIGYVRLARFSRNAGSEVRKALIVLKDEGMTSLILDLRHNPGGLLPAAVEVTQNFLEKGEEIVSTQGRARSAIRKYLSVKDPVCPDIPMVVLVDEGSASASEIVSGALQDLDRAVILGKTTFGKGLVQTLVNFRDGRSLKITTARYYTPSGRLIQKSDYFNEDDDVFLQPKSDQEGPDAEERYLTKGGRLVYGGGGITPDVEVSPTEMGMYETEIIRGGYFYDFAASYLEDHSEKKDATVTPEIIAEFQDYLASKDFQYQTEIEEQIENLRQLVEQDSSVDSEVNECLQELHEALENSRPDYLEMHRDFISDGLQREIAGLQQGRAGRIEASFNNDTQMQAVLELLSDPDVYARILTGTEHAMGTPE